MDPRSRHASAWLAVTCALGLHVADEAAHDFLSVYNPAVANLRDRLPWAPLPQFSFQIWLGGLIVGVTILLLLTPLVRFDSRLLLWASFVLGALMVCNALGHLVGSLYAGRALPGVYSSPFLLAASVWLLVAAGGRAGCCGGRGTNRS